MKLVPLYKLRCKSCNKVFEQTSSVNDRLNIRCECSGNTEIISNLEDNHICYKCGEKIDHPIHYYIYEEGKEIEICRDCKNIWDIKHSIAKIVSNVFTPFWHPNLDKKPVWIKSKKHLKEESDKRNMTSYY